MMRFILLPHIKIHNANAMSSPYTIGFPAMTAWLGAVHALQRRIHNEGLEDIELLSVAVSCHHFNLQTYQGPGDFVHSIVGTANPLDKDGSRPPFVEEARCHLHVSLLIECCGLDSSDRERFVALLNEQLPRMKLAGGDILSCRDAMLCEVDEDEPQDVQKLLRCLMPGYVLIERRDLMVQAMRDEGMDALDAMLSYLKVMHRSEQDDNDQVTWTSGRKTQGWLAPIAVGFQGISSLGPVAHQRDSDTPHRFAESVLTLGEFKMPYRIRDLDDMLWQYHADIEQELYLCETLSSSNLIGE